jgi:hypothetical protein
VPSLVKIKDNKKISNQRKFLSYFKYPLRLESFYSLSLNLPQTKPNILTSENVLDSFFMSGFTLYELFYNYFKPEHISEMKCENCSKDKANKKGFIKKQAIAKLPVCLAIHIQRNSWSGNNLEMVKQTNFVQFPLEIKIDNNKNDSIFNVQNSTNTSDVKNLYNFIPNSQFSLKQVGIGGLLGGKSLAKKINPLKKDTSPFENKNQASSYRYELKSAVVHYGKI